MDWFPCNYLPLSCAPSYHSRDFPSMDTLVDSLPHQMHLMHSDVIQPYPRMGKDTLERCYGTLMQVAMNCSYCIAILLTKDIPTFPGSLWVWIPPMTTNIWVLCYRLICRRCALKMYSALPPEGRDTINLTLVQPNAFKQHFARCEHSLSNSPDDSQGKAVYAYTAGRCCLYRCARPGDRHNCECILLTRSGNTSRCKRACHQFQPNTLACSAFLSPPDVVHQCAWRLANLRRCSYKQAAPGR